MALARDLSNLRLTISREFHIVILIIEEPRIVCPINSILNGNNIESVLNTYYKIEVEKYVLQN